MSGRLRSNSGARSNRRQTTMPHASDTSEGGPKAHISVDAHNPTRLHPIPAARLNRIHHRRAGEESRAPLRENTPTTYPGAAAMARYAGVAKRSSNPCDPAASIFQASNGNRAIGMATTTAERGPRKHTTIEMVRGTDFSQYGGLFLAPAPHAAQYA